MRHAVGGTGLAPDIPMATYPMPMFMAESDLSPVARDFELITGGLLNWSPPKQAQTSPMLEKITIEGADADEVFSNFNTLFLKRKWGDGLPLIPPTDKRVAWILQGSDAAPEHELGQFLPRGAIVTMETLAVALAMAGGRPEYLPVLEAIVQAVFDPGLTHEIWQATSASTYPAIVVNGPVSRQIRINHGFGLIGPDPANPAGASIGRALRLLQQNVGGALPGTGTMAMFGGMRYTNAVFAEDEQGLPSGWQSFATDHFGLAPGANSVSINVCSGDTNIVRRFIANEPAELEAEGSLMRVVSYISSLNANCFEAWAEGTPGLLVMSRTIAQGYAALGWSKQSMREFIWQHARIPVADLKKTGLFPWMERAALHAPYEDPWPITAKANNIAIVIAGGTHPTHTLWMQSALTPKMTNAPIKLPKRWDELVEQGRLALGFDD